MGQPKTKTVGGGANTQTSDQWNQFLQGMLKGGGGNSGGGGGSTDNGNPANFVPSGGNVAGAQPQQAVGQASQFQNLFNSLTNQTPTSITQNNPFIQQAQNLPQAPGFVAPQTQQLHGSDISSLFSNGSIPGYLPTGGQALQSQFGQAQGGVSQAGQSSFNPNQIASINSLSQGMLNQGLSNPTNDPNYAATQAYLTQQGNINNANAAAKFNLGGGGLSSGASLANAQQSAQTAGQNAQNLYNMGLQSQQLGLQNQGQNLSAQLSNQSNLIGQRAGDVGSMTNTGIANAGNQTQSSIANAGNSTQASLANLQARLQGSAQNNQFNIARMGNQVGAATSDAGNQLQAGSLNNQFAQNNAQNNNSFNQQNYSQGSSNALNQGQLGMQIQQLLQQGNMGAIQQLFQSMQQSNQIGSPQAQTVQTPNAWQQAIGGINDVLGVAKGVTSLIPGMGGGPPPMGMNSVAPPSGQMQFSMPQFNPQTMPSVNLGASMLQGGGYNPGSQQMTGYQQFGMRP